MSPRKKSSSGGNRIYFSKETEQAIIRYNQSDDPLEREQIYRNSIYKPFDKLAENIINTFKFPYMNDSFEDIKSEVVSFLVLNLHKYKEDNGKAFSYFSVIAKNYLILHNNTGYKEEKRSITLSDESNGTDGITSTEIPEDMLMLEHPHQTTQEDTRLFVAELVSYWDDNVARHFKKKRDQEIARAIVDLFRRCQNIEDFNKKALYLMIREMTNHKTNHITKVINKMKLIVAKQMSNFHSHGRIGGKESVFLVSKK
jgi:hypothetical protein